MGVKRSVKLTVEWRGQRKGSILELDTGTADGLIRSGYALPVSDETPREQAPALLTRKRRVKSEGVKGEGEGGGNGLL